MKKHDISKKGKSFMIDAKNNMIEDVAKSIVANRLVLFIGAGFAMNIKLPSWKILLEQLLEAYSPKIKPSQKKEVKNLINYGYLSDAVEKIAEYSNTGPNEIKSKVAHYFSKHQNEDDIKTSKLYHYLKELYNCGANKIVTTNYDSSIETILEITGNNILNPNSKLPGIKAIRESIIEGEYYLKLHGGNGDPSSLVLFEEDYRNKYIFDNQIPNLLQELFTHNRILFLGCGLNDKYMEIFEELKLRDAVMDSYVICLEDEHKRIAAKNGINRITINNYEELPSLLEKILEKTQLERQRVSKKILFSDIPLETYDYTSAKRFFEEVAKDDVQGCYFFNTQVEFSSWFSPSLQLHLSQQMEAYCNHKDGIEHYRILFIPYNLSKFINKLTLDNGNNPFFHSIKAMVKMHQSMQCTLAFITSDVFKSIISINKEFFNFHKSDLGLEDLDTNDLNNIDEVLQKQNENGYWNPNDLDFSVIMKKESKQIWQANYNKRTKMFEYNQISARSSKKSTYEQFHDIIIGHVNTHKEELSNPEIEGKGLICYLGLGETIE